LKSFGIELDLLISLLVPPSGRSGRSLLVLPLVELVVDFGSFFAVGWSTFFGRAAWRVLVPDLKGFFCVASSGSAAVLDGLLLRVRNPRSWLAT
jgi:hypothetical protein